MKREPHFWFPAKRYGWGWGLPVCWQGWVVLAAFVVLVIAGPFLFPPTKALGRFLVYIGGLSGLLVAIGWFKGEPPRWRWGKN